MFWYNDLFNILYTVWLAFHPFPLGQLDCKQVWRKGIMKEYWKNQTATVHNFNSIKKKNEVLKHC